MARRSTLTAGLVLAVLLGHGLVLEWLARQAQAEASMRLMTAPMFTRLLQPQAPQPTQAAPAGVAVARGHRASSVVRPVARSTPPQATATTATEPAVVAETTSSEETGTFTIGPALASTEPSTEPSTAQASVAATAPAAPAASAPAPPSTAASGSPTMENPAALDSWPVDTRLNYRVGGYFRGELHGNARVQWQREAARYQTRIDIDLGIVSLVMTSQGDVTAQGLAPKAYEETRAGKARTALLKETQIVLSDGSQVARPDGVQDTASQFVELSHHFSSGRLPLEVGRSVTFWMARPGGVDLWTYDVADKETLQTPQFGAVEAFHLKPRPQPNARGNITAEMWFAPSLQYLPVRIRVSTGDAHLDLMVEKIEQR